VAGLEGLRGEVEAGTIVWDPALEDVHMNLESALRERIGPLAGRLHTGRSRNDQVATDLRLWLRRTIDGLDEAILGMERALVGLAVRDGEAVLPGTTHIQPAQPVLLAHHLLAYVEMLERDRGRLADCRRRANVSPLGSGALAGAGYPLDREATAAELGFDGVTANSLDAVSDRDFVVEALAAFALCMVHLSRLAEEITWWSNPRFGFVRAADSFSTGSSMMPNKKNPDPAELVRGRSARVIGSLTGMLALLKGLPLAYQRDLQEDKPPLFESASTLEASLGVMAGMVSTLTVDRERMRAAAGEGYTTATAVADALVRRGVAFRAAHHIVGTLVAEAEKGGVGLEALDDATIAAALAASDDTVAAKLRGDAALPGELRAAAGLDGALAGCDVVGGTAPRRVAAALAAARARLGS
jgi:argininosuccinate lyase